MACLSRGWFMPINVIMLGAGIPPQRMRCITKKAPPASPRMIMLDLVTLLFLWFDRDFRGIGPGSGRRSRFNDSARRFGPIRRQWSGLDRVIAIPQAGWIVLHIEGEPYERGYQHGRLMAPEIARFVGEIARYRSSKAPADAWQDLRLLADALFLRRFDSEYLEEMKGIADGAAAAGAKWDGRPLDLIDLVTINADVETNFLENALEATATGLEGRRFREPPSKGPFAPRNRIVSAFAATGPATADGQVVFGHITMWNLFHAYHYNVWLDVKPARGHRVLMQTYPGGIMSGLDYYMNDRGIVVCETTIAQTKFDATGIPLVDRIRRDPSVWRLDRHGGRRSCARATTASTPTSGCWPTPRPTRSRCSSWARTRAGSGRAARTNGSAGPPGFTGGATTPRTCR